MTVAADAEEARAARDDKNFDLILLDIWMPDTDGITLLREWSDGGDLKSPVVIMSGHGTVDTAVEATRLGAFDFVEKPLSLAKLLRTVEAALESAEKQARSAHTMLPSLLAPVGRSQIDAGIARERCSSTRGMTRRSSLTGEPGSGRGAFARYLHALSSRSDEPLVSITAASSDLRVTVEEQLLGSEVDGAIHAGAFERASGRNVAHR